MTSGLLTDLPQRPTELGRIRMGEKGDRGQPVRLRTFRLTSGNKALLEAAASLYGGKVAKWDGAPDEGFWQLTTGADQLDILIPATTAAISQAYEHWQGGTCARRCDGTTEVVSGKPCLCAAAGQSGPDRTCEIMTRISVMLPRLPGLGVWRLDTGGYAAATTLPSTLSLLASMTPGVWIRAVLRAEQRSRKVRLPDGKVQTNRFVVPVLDLPGTTIGQLVAGIEPPALLESGERQAPPTAAQKVAERRAAIEARTNHAEPGSSSPGSPAASGAGPASQAPLPAAAPDEPVAGQQSEAPVAGAAVVTSPLTPAAASLCGAKPDPDGPLAMSEPCTLPAEHTQRLHKSSEGSWPK